jgi:hypothetical protein
VPQGKYIREVGIEVAKDVTRYAEAEPTVHHKQHAKWLRDVVGVDIKGFGSEIKAFLAGVSLAHLTRVDFANSPEWEAYREEHNIAKRGPAKKVAEPEEEYEEEVEEEEEEEVDEFEEDDSEADDFDDSEEEVDEFEEEEEEVKPRRPAKKVAPAKRAAPAKKAVPARGRPAKKVAPTPAKKASPAKKAAPRTRRAAEDDDILF